MIDGIIWRYRCGAPWRDLPAEFGAWQTVWRRRRQFAEDGTWDKIHAEPLKQADAAGLLDCDVAVDSTVNRAHQHGTNLPHTTGALPNEQNLLEEPPDHGIGRSRSGLTSKIHHLVDGRRAPAGRAGSSQGGDSPMVPSLLGQLRVERDGPGRPRTTPDRFRGDKAYFSRAIRQLLAARHIKATIPHPSDQIGHRKKRGAGGGRPPKFDEISAPS